MSLRRSTFRVLMVLLVLVGVVGLPTAAGAQTANGIKTPSDGATVGGIVEVAGYANTLGFQKWQLDLLPDGKPEPAVWLAIGTAPGAFTYDLNTTPFPAGQYQLRLRVVKYNGNYDEYFTKLTFAAQAPATTTVKPTATITTTVKPTTAITPTIKATTPVTATAAAQAAEAVQNVNGIKSPANGTTVGGIVVVAGYANSPDFNKWQLDLLPGGNADQATFLALGTTPGAFTYHLNTPAYPAGEYQLRLRVVRNDSNYDEYLTKLTFAPEPTKPAIKPAAAVVTATHEIVAQNVNGIVTPKDGATINGVAVVTGYANSTSFMKWQLDLVPDGIVGVVPIFLTLGTTPGTFSYNLPTSLFPTGRYQLRLRVVHENSNYDEYSNMVRITR